MVERYLKLISLDEGLECIENLLISPKEEQITLLESLGRITSGPVFAGFSTPQINLSAMDGIAVKSRDTEGATEQHPELITDCARVNTGNIVPPDFDAVVMIEDTWEGDGGYIIRKSASPWQHIRPAGEDIGESEMIIPSLHRIRPQDIGALASYGVGEVPVLSLQAGIVPTGSELLSEIQRPPPGKVVESNSYMAAAMLSEMGVKVKKYPVVQDDPDSIRKAIVQGIRENEMLLVSAGSSAGTKDYTSQVINELGEVLVHGMAIKPAKPVIIGRIDDKPVIGLPGYPLAAWTIMREVVRPLLGKYGFRSARGDRISISLTHTLHSSIGTDEFVLVSAGKVNGRWVGVPLSRGSGVQMSAVRANAYIRIPSSVEGVESGSETEAVMLSPIEEAESALIITGSHDPAIDYLADLTAASGTCLYSTNVGSMGGIISLKKRQCHAAPMHLLSNDGSYNTGYIRRYLPGEDIVLVCLAEREQGIASRTGITFDELTSHTFVNRQKGSGTRMLLDHLLANKGISPASISGYDNEVNTHIAVTLAVKSGSTDAGMCVYSAAKALGLKFVAVGTERYELAMYRDSMDDLRISTLIEAIRSKRFKEILERLGGYKTGDTGKTRNVD